MKTKLLFILIFLSKLSFGQDSISQLKVKYQTEFDLGIGHLEKNEINEAKQNFKNLIVLAPSAYAGYNFLGICFFNEKNYDSTIYYLKKSIEFNSQNLNRSKEMTISRLVTTFMLVKDFKSSFETGLNAIKEFPESQYFKKQLKDICLWSYYITYEKLDSKYLTTELLKEYKVSSVAQEYLIMRTIKINDHSLNFMNQKYLQKENKDILTCNVNKTKDSIELSFKLQWDITKELGGKSFDSEKIYNDKTINIWDRIGAKYKLENKFDIIEEYEKLNVK